MTLASKTATVKPKKKRKFWFWPKPNKPGVKRGPNPKQKLPWIERMPDDIRPHWHDMDILLYLGSTRSGKSIAAVARGLWIAMNFPNARIIVGSVNFAHLEKTIIRDYKRLLSRKKEWDHRSILRKPNRASKEIVFKNGATISFVNLEDYLLAAGTECDFLHIEEPELLKDEQALEYMMTRMSGTAVPFKQVILTANPNAEVDWMIRWFKLKQFAHDYKGAPQPIGQACKCHICVKCEERRGNEVAYIKGKCPVCKHIKDNKCPGNQHFIRVVHITADDNSHLRDGYKRDLNATLSYEKRIQLVEGLVFESKKGKCYSSYDSQTCWPKDVPIDPGKRLIWALDFNQYPQCSVICQEYVADGMTHVAVLDEIVKYGSGPERIAKEFVERYKKLKLRDEVHIFGDPAGFTRVILPNDDVTDRYKIIYKILEEEGFDVVLRARPTIYPISKRIDSVNWMLKDGNEYRRMRFNTKVLNTIASAESTKWGPDGKKEDETEDKKARKKGADGEVWALTHPMCALGYYIVEEHPMVPDDAGAPYVHSLNEGRMLEGVNGQVSEHVYSDEELQAEIDDELEDEELEEEIEYENRSFASEFRDYGVWGN